MSSIDLHIHSVYSEGALSCRQIVERAKQHDISVIALTDHNVLDGNQEMMDEGERAGLTILSGVEIYSEFESKQLHLLGYNFRLEQSPLTDALSKLQLEHASRVRVALNQFASQGFRVEPDHLFDSPSKYLGFSHIFSHLEQWPENVERIATDIGSRQATLFQKIDAYFGPGRLCSLPQSTLPIEQAIQLVHGGGGIAVLAHPGQQLLWTNDHIIAQLKTKGLDGIEVFSPYHTWHHIEHYLKLASALGLHITGGSDYHSNFFPVDAPIQNQWDYFRVPMSVYEQLKPSLQ